MSLLKEYRAALERAGIYAHVEHAEDGPWFDVTWVDMEDFGNEARSEQVPYALARMVADA